MTWSGSATTNDTIRAVPELPDLRVYAECLRRRVVGRRLGRIRVLSPFLVRSVEPPVESFEGRPCQGVSLLGKRIVLEFPAGGRLVVHLMVAGRLLWAEGKIPGRTRNTSATFEFEGGTLVLTEAGTTKRASLHAMGTDEAFRALDPGGIDPTTCSPSAFEGVLRAENRTLKRRLTDPRAFVGIGNAYSDEVLHAAGLSPVRLTRSLSPEEVTALARATRETLEAWTARLFRDFGLDAPGSGRFPRQGEVTAFRPDFAVHGRFGLPCPRCAEPVQRIVHAENETNYCAKCQNEGRVLKDRSLSRLLRDDWPRTIEQWHEHLGG